MRVESTSDSPSWTKVFEITDELNSLSEILEKKYPTLDWDLAVCMRCLPKKLERKTRCRYYAKDKMLGLDIAMDEEDFVPLKKDKAAQRRLVGAAFITFLESIKKYDKKHSQCSTVFSTADRRCAAMAYRKGMDRLNQRLRRNHLSTRSQKSGPPTKSACRCRNNTAVRAVLTLYSTVSEDRSAWLAKRG